MLLKKSNKVVFGEGLKANATALEMMMKTVGFSARKKSLLYTCQLELYTTSISSRSAAFDHAVERQNKCQDFPTAPPLTAPLNGLLVPELAS